MDEFDDLIKLPSRNEILAKVDEYTLYRYYTEIDDLIPGIAYRSPLRNDDEIPSFTIFPASRGRGFDEFEYTWKDHKLNDYGNIFKLIKLRYGLRTFEDVYALIGNDFDLGFNSGTIEKISLYNKPAFVESKIRVNSISLTSKGITFWRQFGIEKPLLDFYNTTQISHYWSSPTQATPKQVLEPTFAYRIGNYYQVYSPYAPRDQKFRNDLPLEYFFGYLQLPTSGDVLILDKSAKDCIFCRSLGYWAIAGKSETTEIPEKKMWELKDRFKRTFLMLDPDMAGMRQTELYLSKYPWLEPRFLTIAKDKTDACKLVGVSQVKEILTNLLI